MRHYILRRLLMLVPVMIGISFLVFAIMATSNVDPVNMILPQSASQEDRETLREELGINDPFLVQYANYMADALQGDLGKSYRTKDYVADMIKLRFPVTFKLTCFAMIIAAVLGIFLGIIAATNQNTILDNTCNVGALAGMAFPNFWLGMILIYIFSFKLDLLPSFGLDSWKGYILPSIAISVGSLSTLLRTTRSTLLEVIRQDYIRAARGKGAKERTVIYHHALRNALIPVITVVGINFGYLLAGTVVIETVFSIPGMGTMLLSAIRTNDTPVVMGGVIVLALAFSLINLGVDVIYSVIDPRIKAGNGGN